MLLKLKKTFLNLWKRIHELIDKTPVPRLPAVPDIVNPWDPIRPHVTMYGLAPEPNNPYW